MKDAYFPDILKQLGVSQEQIDFFESEIREKGSVLIPKVKILIENQERLFSLLSTKTKNKDFEYLNGIQGQFVDRTNEYKLTLERDQLIESQLNDKKLIEEKSKKLESLAIKVPLHICYFLSKNFPYTYLHDFSHNPIFRVSSPGHYSKQFLKKRGYLCVEIPDPNNLFDKKNKLH